MWKHIFGYGNTRFCLCQDTGTMNLPLRLTDCSPRISWVYVGISRCVSWVFPCVRWVFVDCLPRISWYEYGILGWYAKPKPLREL